MVERISVSEIRKTIATSLGAAFGIVIGMIWTQVVLGIFNTAGISLTASSTVGNWKALGFFVTTAVIVTVACVLAIVLISRWGSKEEKSDLKI